MSQCCKAWSWPLNAAKTSFQTENDAGTQTSRQPSPHSRAKRLLTLDIAFRSCATINLVSPKMVSSGKSSKPACLAQPPEWRQRDRSKYKKGAMKIEVKLELTSYRVGWTAWPWVGVLLSAMGRSQPSGIFPGGPTNPQALRMYRRMLPSLPRARHSSCSLELNDMLEDSRCFFE